MIWEKHNETIVMLAKCTEAGKVNVLSLSIKEMWASQCQSKIVLFDSKLLELTMVLTCMHSCVIVLHSLCNISFSDSFSVETYN